MPTQDDSEVLDRIKRRIDSEYHEAIQAWERLRRYLDGKVEAQPASPPPPLDSAKIQILQEEKFRHGSNKDRVLSYLKVRPGSVDEIVQATGLEKRQVRGVLYAKDVQMRIVGTKVGSIMSFQCVELERGKMTAA